MTADATIRDHPGSWDCVLGRGSAAFGPGRDFSSSVTAVLIRALAAPA